MSARPLIDPGDMWGAVRGLPSQLLDGWASAKSAAPEVARCDHVLVAGMGGSAIAGDLAASLWIEHLTLPVTLVRGGPLPGWVGPTTLVLACSYSGDTAETLRAYDEAGLRNAQRIVITVGGELAARAVRDGVGLLRMPGGGQPRAAIGVGLTAVLAILYGVGAIPDPGPILHLAAGAMTDLIAADSVETRSGPAGPTPRGSSSAMPHTTAAAMGELLPIVYVPTALGPVGRRWKTQLNENAKLSSFWEEIPELDHNAVVGYAGPPSARREAVLIGLSAPAAGADAARRLAITLGLASDEGWRTLQVAAPAGSLATEGLWLVSYGDLLSLHLAARQGIDPSPVEMIRRLKELLGAAPE